MNVRHLSGAIITLVMAAVAAAGCTNTHIGTAVPQPIPSTTTSSADRPRELKIDGFKSCELLSEAQQAELQINQPPHQREDPIFNSDTCNFNNHTTSTTLGLYVMLKHDVSHFAPGNVNGVARAVRILGFPGFEVRPEVDEPPLQQCAVNIGVSTGQVLRSQYITLGEKHALPQEEVCRRATRGLELALGNILAKK
ncbi:DUF3558 domain-containing protein [Allokutzneria albata]|uniref:DUF3558 domain-containing protein n=1 Tax=Allokutzneria albata TaxID=211114 RepID=A0A1G9X2F6_ALLAB|nr:DUF3558 domain-containing protein [Allokutzneria albata]SDM90888.1 Protein of unknown function [Allokutzneria albata]